MALSHMSQKSIHLISQVENPVEVPDEIQRLGNEAWRIIWQTAHDTAQQEIDKVKLRYQQYEVEVLKQRQDALDKTAQVIKEVELARGNIDTLTRENKTLQVDLNQKIGELKGLQDQIAALKENLAQREMESKHLTEELGRSRENGENLKKRLYETTHQAEQDRAALKVASEDSAVNLRTKERIEKNLKAAMQETEQTWKQLKIEQTRAAVADALVQELRETVKRLEGDVKMLKDEKQDIKTNLDAEFKVRTEQEKKIATLTARSESQELGYKELIMRLERELESAKSEAASMRNRLIKTEGALEREKKATERLETKLVAASSSR